MSRETQTDYEIQRNSQEAYRTNCEDSASYTKPTPNNGEGDGVIPSSFFMNAIQISEDSFKFLIKLSAAFSLLVVYHLNHTQFKEQFSILLGIPLFLCIDISSELFPIKVVYGLLLSKVPDAQA